MQQLKGGQLGGRWWCSMHFKISKWVLVLGLKCAGVLFETTGAWAFSAKVIAGRQRGIGHKEI